MNESIEHRRYRHYKGNEYEVIGEATHTETEERLVIYRSIEGVTNVWARPHTMFFEMVEVDGETIPRFALMDNR